MTTTSRIAKTDTALLVCMGGKRLFVCENFKEASAIVRGSIVAENLGSTDFYKRKNAGMIYHHSKGVIAHISYNGSVWKGDGSQLRSEEVTDLLAIDIK